MGNAPRAFNRIALAIIGIVFIAVAAGITAVTLVDDVKAKWDDAVAQVEQPTRDVFDAAATPWGFSWITVGVVALAVIFVLLVIRWIIAQRGNRTSTLVSRESGISSRGDHGSTELSAKFAKDAIKQSFEQNPDVLNTSVSVLQLPQKKAGLLAKVEVRQGANPAELIETSRKTINGLDVLLGRQVPVTVYMTGGVRTLLTQETQRVD